MDVGSRGREALAWLFWGLLILLALALVSFDPLDPSFNRATAVAPNNWIGSFGAIVADLCYQLFGYAAWALLTLAAVAAYALFSKRFDLPTGAPALFWIPCIFSLAGIVAAHGSWLAWLFGELPAGSGGMLGAWVASHLQLSLQGVGRDLVLLALLFSSFVAASNLSLITVGRWLWSQGWHLIGFIQQKMSERRDRMEGREYRKAELSTREERQLKSDPEIAEPVKLRVSKQAMMQQAMAAQVELLPSPAAEPPAVAPVAAPVQAPLPLFRPPAAAPAACSQSVAMQQLLVPQAAGGPFRLPTIALFNPKVASAKSLSREALNAMARMLEKKLLDYRVEGRVVAVQPGPVVVQFEFEPAPGAKVNRIIALEDDLARAMSAVSVRVAGNIPGKSVVGIEIPNEERESVVLYEVLASPEFADRKKILPLAIGVDIAGHAVVADLAKMPHLLVAGTTGAGKSVSINTMICSLLMRYAPSDLRLIMVDPKMLELSMYEGIPHLLVPVVTDPRKAAKALAWAVLEMERRYLMMSEAKVRNLESYNQQIAAVGGEKLPLIVIVIDELADLMMIAGKEVEMSICRIAQKARAAGLHLILATQRPSVDVITGLIKANLPSRISFRVSSKIDSRTILDQMGAEQLLGMGDSLFMSGGREVRRVHGAFVSDGEVQALVEFLKAQGEPEYRHEVFEVGEENEGEGGDEGDDGFDNDEKYDEAVALVIERGQCSASMIQRFLRIGYNRSSRMVERMEREGLVTPPGTGGMRKVLARSQRDGGGVRE